MTARQDSGRLEGSKPGRWLRFRSWVRYGTGLRAKLVVLVLAVALLVVGALYGFSLASLRVSIGGIYEQRARSVAAVISKSIQEKDYILYYSDELDADIDRLLERYESVVDITVVGLSARGFLVVASTDPATVGALADSADQERYAGLQEVTVAPVRIGGVDLLRAEHPIFSGADLIGVVVMDMSLDEQAQAITHLSWQFGLASLLGFLLIGGLLYLAMRGIVTKPVTQLAEAVGAVSERKYDVEVPHPFRRVPGTRLVDEVGRLVDGFNLMVRVIHSHEQELKKLVVLDEWTGAYTREHLAEELERELSKTRRYKHPTSVLLMDLSDVAGRSNDEQNRVLLSAANFLKRNLRNVDVLFRVDSFRFVSLLPETPPEGATTAAERLRAQLPDLTAAFDFSFSPQIIAMGWSEEGAPATDDVMERIAGRLSDLRG